MKAFTVFFFAVVGMVVGFLFRWDHSYFAVLHSPYSVLGTVPYLLGGAFLFGLFGRLLCTLFPT